MIRTQVRVNVRWGMLLGIVVRGSHVYRPRCVLGKRVRGMHEPDTIIVTAKKELHDKLDIFA